MENASKALIMAAEILIGVMILSIAVYLFSEFAGYSSRTYQEIADRQTAEFNARFYRYFGTRQDDNGKEIPIECTIHDIMSLANFAKQYNLENELIEEIVQAKRTTYIQKPNVTLENSLYIQIDLGNNIKNLELKTESELIALIKKNDLVEGITGEKTEQKRYRCTVCEPRGGNQRINYVKFEEMK